VVIKLNCSDFAFGRLAKGFFSTFESIIAVINDLFSATWLCAITTSCQSFHSYINTNPLQCCK